MNIEKLLDELGQDLQNAPVEMDKPAMRKSMTRKRTLHRIGVAGRTVGIALASLFLVLFVGVNTSVKFARAASDVPVIGKLSNAMIVSDDIGEALVDHEDLEKAIEAGHLMDIGITLSGTNSPVKITLSSAMVDDHMFTAFIKLDTERKAEGFYTIQNAKITDMDTGEVIKIVEDLNAFDVIGENTIFRYAWNKGHTNFIYEFDLVDELTDFTGWTVLDSFRFEIRNAEYEECRCIPIDQTITFEGFDFHFSEIRISETGTKVIFEIPKDKKLSFGGLGIVIEDEDGNILASPVPNSAYGYEYEGDDGKTYTIHLLSSFYYEDVSKIRLRITDIFCAIFEDDVLTIDKGTDTATFRGETFPIKVYYGDETSNTDLGLSAEYDEYFSWEREFVYYFLVPVKEDMPAFNAQKHLAPNWLTAVSYEYPRTTIDGQEYIVIQAVCWDADGWIDVPWDGNGREWHLRDFENDCEYYFVHGRDYETYELDTVFELTVP